MVACETDEPNQRQQVLTVGSEVEVSSDEEGFKGAWFGATIIQYPTSSASRNRKTKRALVEYKTLVTEDGLEPLKEYVDLAHIRHLPPAMDNQQDFVEGDVVDVDYRDGWWTGVISKVLGDSKYRVFFENPPDVIEFEHKNLRFHQDLIRGDWIRPERQVLCSSYLGFAPLFSFLFFLHFLSMLSLSIIFFACLVGLVLVICVARIFILIL